MNRIDVLMNFRRMKKLQESALKETCLQYKLSLTAANVIAFLYNNPEKDTAKDIVELRMLSKGNVSQAIEELLQKSLLQKEVDTIDHRKIHLSLLPEAKPIAEMIENAREELFEGIFKGLSKEELKQFEKINDRIMENAKEEIKRRGL